MHMTETLMATERTQDSLVRCVADAYKALKLIPGVDPNGPILVWLTGQFLDMQQEEASASSRKQ
jgi:hypothetical protein